MSKSVLYSLVVFFFQEASQDKISKAYQEFKVQLGISKFTW